MSDTSLHFDSRPVRWTGYAALIVVTLFFSGAFSECTSLRVLDIPASVKILEEDAFEDCDMLSMVAVPSHLAKDAKLCFPNVDLAILD